MNKTDMERFGLPKKYYDEAILTNNQKVGRIVSRENENYKVITEFGEVEAEVSNKFKYESKDLSQYPVPGDFVILEINNDFNSTIHEILNRKSYLIRKAEWDSNYDHIVAANIDTIFICMPLGKDINNHKLKAYISIANKCNCETVIILSECDSLNDRDATLSEIEKITKDMEVIITSNLSNDGWKSVKNYIQEGKTIVFIGPESDKIKMVRKILGDIKPINDLVLIPGGGVLIDTPEMRELGIENINILNKFADLL